MINIADMVNEINQGNFQLRALTTDTLILGLGKIGGLCSTTSPETISWYITSLDDVMDITHSSFLARMIAFVEAGLGITTLRNITLIGAFPPSTFVGSAAEHLSAPDFTIFMQRIRNNISYAMRLHTHMVNAANDHMAGRRLEVGQEDDDGEDMPDKKPHQILADYLLNSAAELGLRRQGTDLYQMLKLPDGTPTNFFKVFSEIDRFVWTQAASHNDAKMASFLTGSQKNPAHMSDILQKIDDPRLPTLVTRRTLFAYCNGVYDTVTDIFYAHNCVDGGMGGGKVRPMTELGGDVAAINYFPVDFQLSALWGPATDIETPFFDLILKTQDFDLKTRDWFYAMLGRMLHDVGSLDDWQVCLYLTGVAGSGKSTIFRVFAEIYTAMNVGYLGDNVSGTFGIEHLLDKLIVLCLDISANFTLQATRLNSFVSGETIVVDRKYKSAQELSWKSQIAFCSNVLPPIASNAGSGVRRFLCFRFANRVAHTDPQLISKVRSELPLFLVKAARLYLHKLDLFGQVGLWDDENTLPKLCHELRQEYQRLSEPIAEFLASDLVAFGPHLEIDYKELGRAYRVYYNTTGLPRPAKHFGHPDFISAVPREYMHLISIVNGVGTIIKGLALA